MAAQHPAKADGPHCDRFACFVRPAERACGYAIDDEENELGIRCVALAIPGPGGKADSAFSISGLAPYMTPERIRRIAALALETRADILRDLGVQGV